jgi:hypothetical protein
LVAGVGCAHDIGRHLFVQCGSDVRCDDRRLLVLSEVDCALKAMQPGDKHLEPAAERIGGDPCFMGRRYVSTTSDHRAFDRIAPVAGIPFVSKMVIGMG